METRASWIREWKESVDPFGYRLQFWYSDGDRGFLTISNAEMIEGFEKFDPWVKAVIHLFNEGTRFVVPGFDLSGLVGPNDLEKEFGEWR